jgi:hypothetical protein
MRKEFSVSKSKLKLYIGIPENSTQEYLYLDLAIPGRSVNLYTSPDEIGDDSAEDFMKVLSDAINEATLWIRSLGIKLTIDAETIRQIADDYSERASKEVYTLIKEI